MRIKTLILNRLNIPVLGTRDNHLINRIHKETGWKRPCKKDKEAFFFRYYNHLDYLEGITREKSEIVKLPTLVKTAVSQKKAFYQSEAWMALRYEVLKKSKGACECCGATPLSSGKPLHVDHIKPRSKFPELALEITNLQVLCFHCNLGKSNKDDTDWRRVA